ncbi:hypothetical protein [Lentzea sp. NPDC060358]|uniref:hypothetical protein n=1 Tax=Lentzea sp. NPDC060358 TaxID=3347103 RepID=UPI00364E580D
MVDMWMLSVAAALIGSGEEPDSAALTQLEKAVRGVPGLGDVLDAARAADGADAIRLAGELAEGLKAAYDGGGAFAALLDTLWPQVLFGPAATNVSNVLNGTVTGTVIQLGAVGSVTLPGPPSPLSPPSPARPRFSFFGSGRRGRKDRS